MRTSSKRPRRGMPPGTARKGKASSATGGKTSAKKRAKTSANRGAKARVKTSGKAPAKATTAAGRTGGSPYHHGDLRRALLAATEELLEAAGVEGFTLREVARRAGVSHGAPAHHFGDVSGLLTEFTAESFLQLSAAMRRRRARASDIPFEQLVASGIGYVEYAITNRARFQLMFRSERLDPSRPSFATAAAEAFGQLVECIDRVSREAGAPPELDADKVALAWSMVHGFATLLIDNKGFASLVSGGSRGRALETVKRLIESSRAAFARRE